MVIHDTQQSRRDAQPLNASNDVVVPVAAGTTDLERLPETDRGADEKRRNKRNRRRRGRKAGPGLVAPAVQGARALPPSLDAKLRQAERAIQMRQQEERSAASPPTAPAPIEIRMPSADAVGGAPRMPAYAALDLGTNNCRLLVAVPTRPGQFRVIDAFSRIVRLGEGLGRTGSLAATAMDRAVAALEICAQKLSAREISGARLIATEACRSAANGAEFIERVRCETGLRLEIVSRETEARLAVSGCGSLVDRNARGAVLFDIGGGSSEIALLDLRGGASRRLSNHIVAWTSLPVGVVSLAERHGGRDVTPALFERMVEEVVGLIQAFPGRDRLAALVGRDGFHLLGTSGTVTTLAGVQLRLERYDRRQVDGLWLTDAEVEELIDRIRGWSFEERVANPCIGSDRADLVLAGCAILEGIRRIWPARMLRVADRGLREGLLTEMMVADGVWRRSSANGIRATA
ncbi:Ppx/GppA phosphatase family protein [Aureimonas jatrophae]|uniref:Ppx/GppA phosphatase family protein n=1 Tax=Aureimonas jatrophae TaxID=1166073 RepID=UPI003CC7AEC8